MSEKNYLKAHSFNYQCLSEGDCNLKNSLDYEGKFSVSYDTVPEFIPEDITCPCCSTDEVKHIGFGGIKKSFKIHKVGYEDKDWQKEWYEDEIKNTKQAIDGRQGVSPYAKYKVDYKYMENKGIMKKVKGKEVKERENRANKVASTAAVELHEEEYKNVGHRPNG